MRRWSRKQCTEQHQTGAPLRALVIADRAPGFAQPIGEFVDKHAVDLVITAGDLGLASLEGLDDCGVPRIGVYGNHCDRCYFDVLGITDLHLGKVVINGTSFTGLEGCVRYSDTRSDAQYTQSEYDALVENLPIADVVVTHCPPRGVNDHRTDPAHMGIEALRRWVERYPPRVLIHGHTYPKRPVTMVGATRVEYVHGARVIVL